ncbi:hypothetical protein AMS68_003127 [Peltaster fructicola]|uniref:Potassium transport protein n=1 Tax=Peltaster fructicola TaxID=286661 RepID=A0A6H0XT22_9PEZI|nr:hypothetical protein AMS68_003127 [Peltaster fructicola]
MATLWRLIRPWRWVRAHLPLNFITIHYAYFIFTCLVSAVVFWGASTPARSVTFVDSLFLCVSAMTGAGLNTINLSTTNTFQQFLLFALIMLGSAIWVSAFVVLIRRRAFETKFKIVVRRRRQTASRLRRFSRNSKQDEKPDGALLIAKHNMPARDEPDVIPRDSKPPIEGSPDETPRESTPPARRGGPEMNNEPLDTTDVVFDSAHPGITFRGDTRFTHIDQHITHRRRSSFLNLQDIRHNQSMATSTSSATSVSRRIEFFESAGGWISRNSEFHGLTVQERAKLGGYEYRAVSLLAWLVPAYYILWQLLEALGCAAWVARNQSDTALMNGLDPWWVGAFNAVSAFNNSGMSLLDANMTAFQRSYYLLLTMGLLILAGNTCYPIFLRLIVWCMYRTASMCSWTERAKTLRFLLDHPRRCYTNLFPAQHTWWLLLSVVTLNSIDWAAFEILNINNSLLEDLPVNFRVIDGLFQAFAVRSGGFYVVTIPNLRVSLLVLYVVMMYVSVYPVVITMRNSNVYEERSLGIYAEDEPTSGGILHRIASHFGGGDSNTHFVKQQLRAQLAHDAWWIVLALFLIMIVENQHFVDDPATFSVFNFLFEIVSGYGCVGISVGVPYDAYSFCGSWQTLSKLILCAVMLRGRHRGLPVAIDKALQLPEDGDEEAEEDDGRIRRTISRGRQETV